MWWERAGSMEVLAKCCKSHNNIVKMIFKRALLHQCVGFLHLFPRSLSTGTRGGNELWRIREHSKSVYSLHSQVTMHGLLDSVRAYLWEPTRRVALGSCVWDRTPHLGVIREHSLYEYHETNKCALSRLTWHHSEEQGASSKIKSQIPHYGMVLRLIDQFKGFFCPVVEPQGASLTF
jgi:hypothetical protein